MRVLHVVPSIAAIYGGPSQMVKGLSAAQGAAGAQVTILTTNANGDFGQAPLAVPLDRPVPEAGFEVRYFPCAPFRRYKFSWPLLRWLWTHGDRYDIAHIHALFAPVSTAAALVCRWRRLPYVLRPLGTLDPLDLQKKRWLKQLYGRLLEGPNLAAAAAVHFTSAQEAKISERFGARTRDLIIPLGVPQAGGMGGDRPEDRPEEVVSVAEPLPPLPQTGGPSILFLSRLDPKKGLDLLFPALEILAGEGVPFGLWLAGGNPQDPAYERACCDRARRMLGDRVAVLGFVQGARKRQLLAAADLFVLPSHYENFGIAVAEAMAAGRPVVVADGVHIWPAVQEAEAGWVCGRSVPALVDALRLALADGAERDRRGRNGQRYAAEHYSWPAIARQTLAAYETLLSAPGKRP
ncbi:MAG: glycosyltransferase [Cyanophyceae cyanobacterium]